MVRFFMGGEEIEGEYYDYVDGDGYRRVSFGAVMPMDEQNFAIIYDVDAPREEAVHVLTEETDPDFWERLHLYMEASDKFREEKGAWLAERGVTREDIRDPDSEYNKSTELDMEFSLTHPNPNSEDFGLVFKDSELCSYHFDLIVKGHQCVGGGHLGGNFMHTETAAGKPSGSGSETHNAGLYDWENKTITYKEECYYYVGKE